MPRLSPALIRLATSESPLLTQLLRVCRDLPSARNELRWLQEYTHDVVNAKRYASQRTAAAHSHPGLESPEKLDRSNNQNIILDHAEIKESYIPTRPMHIRDVEKGPLGPLIRNHESFAGGSPIRKHNSGTDDDLFRKHEPSRDTPPLRKRRVYGGGPLIRKYDAHTDDGEVPSKTDPAAEETASAASVKDQKVRGFKTRHTESDSPGLWVLEGKHRNASGTPFKSTPVKVRHTQPASFRIKKWSREGTRTVKVSGKSGKASARDTPFQRVLAENVDKRSQGMPLQYILGNQPFGTLDILCRRDVLIPRPETEMYTEKVAKLMASFLTVAGRSAAPGFERGKKLRILDLCTGTGCIALLLHSILKPPGTGVPALPPGIDIEVLGLDLNPTAIELAQTNLDRTISRKHLHSDAIHGVNFQRMDVLGLAQKLDDPEYQLCRTLNAAAAGVSEEALNRYSSSETWDMVIANPPYIGPKDYELGGKTEPSVRDYEPKDALVPVADGRFVSSAVKQADLFYQPLIRIAQAVDAQLLVMEVGDSSQAERVGGQILNKTLNRTSKWKHKTMPFSVEVGARLEVWRDDEAVRVLPLRNGPAFKEQFAKGTDEEVSDRAVVVWSSPMADWRRHDLPAPDHNIDGLTVPAPASKEIKAKLKRSKDAAKEARQALKSRSLPPKPRGTVPANSEETVPPKPKETERPQSTQKKTFPPSFWENALREESGAGVALTTSQKESLSFMTPVRQKQQREVAGEEVMWTQDEKKILGAMWLLQQMEKQVAAGKEVAWTPKMKKTLRGMKWQAKALTDQMGSLVGAEGEVKALRTQWSEAKREKMAAK